MAARPGVGVSRCSAFHGHLFSRESFEKVSARLRRSLLTLAILPWLFVQASSAQVATGTPPFGSFGGGPFDTINLGNLNVHFAIPIVHKTGRGMPFTYDLSFDSSVWYPSNGTWAHDPNWGWRGVTEAAAGLVTYLKIPNHSCGDGTYGTFYNNWVYHDRSGTPHAFPGIYISNCGNGTNELKKTASDGSGYVMDAIADPSATVYPPGGETIIPPVQDDPTKPGTVYDRNGNYFSSVVNSGTMIFTDTLGTNILKVSPTTNPTSYQFLNPSGNSGGYSTVAVSYYTNYHVKTNFGCNNVHEADAGNPSLVKSIVLPGQMGQYTFDYEKNSDGTTYTGRIASITLPTSGKITYAYSGGTNGIECADGSAATLTRITPDSTTGWTYTRAGTPPSTTTMIAAPDGQSTQTLTFSGIYETNRTVKQGTTLIDTITTCYNGNTLTNCPGATVGIISSKEVYQQLPSGGLISMQQTKYTSYGLPTDINSYDYGTGGSYGLPLQYTHIAYTSFYPNSLGATIQSMPSQVTVSTASATKSSTSYTYDESTPTPVTVAQHATITCRPNTVQNCRGNLTTVSVTTQGTSTLSRHSTYYDTGSVKTTADVNSAQTTYNYADNTTSCNMAFPTSLSLPLNLSTSMTWACNGGVMTGFIDPNSKTASWTYGDADYWRPTATSDLGGISTSLSYTSNSVESVLSVVTGQSVIDTVTTLDGLGRPNIAQRLQAPGGTNYDSVETDYDALGRPYRNTMPYAGTLGQNSSSAPDVLTQYDAMNRVTQLTDKNQGTQTIVFNPGNAFKNDVLVTVGPAPTGESTKKRQMEYDGMGRLTSVCEVTTATGSGTCAQNTPNTTGYFTSYVYDGASGVNTYKVTQGGQTRTYVYDMIGRLISETNPESGATQYFYDTAPGSPGVACPSGTYNGDLVKKYDAQGNTICYAYDALHRVTSIKYPSGPNSANTPSKYFAYDGSTYWPQLTNTKGRFIGGHTCVEPCTGALITDMAISYSPRGEVTDIYSSTPNSGGYYHVTKSYWPHGALKSLGGIPGAPTIYYGASDGSGLDGEGRVTQVTVPSGSGQNPVNSVAYNTANALQPIGALTQVTYSAGNVDQFGYDINTGRMTGYQYNVTTFASPVIGSMAWNANGTLKTLSIVDHFNNANQQTCTYGYDDLARVSSASCGSVWAQTFSFDPFGNITKNGNTTWAPNYTASKNQYQSGWNGITYDNNGNLTNDTFHTYQWDADGHPVVIVDGSSNQTYDVLGNMVELSQPGWSAQYLYDTNGYEFGDFHALAAGSAFIPLPGGGTAIYSGTLQSYGHVDWLGSSRLTSTPSGTVTGENARAPYGEPYAVLNGVPNQGFFAGLGQNIEADLYDTQFREYHRVQGRWISPDPAGLAAVDPSNPQTWNRYAYVNNNPMSAVDPLGLYDDPACNHTDAGCGGMDSGGMGGWAPVSGALALLDSPVANPDFKGWQGTVQSGGQVWRYQS